MEITYMCPANSFSKKEIFQAANSDSTMLQNVPEGTEIVISKFVTYFDEKEGEKAQEVLFLVCEDGFYSSISSTVKRMLIEYADFMGDEIEFPVHAEVMQGKTKAGRSFINLNIL